MLRAFFRIFVIEFNVNIEPKIKFILNEKILLVFTPIMVYN